MCLLSSSAASDLAATGLPAHPCHPPLPRQPQPRLILSGSPSIGTVPPPAVGHTSLLPVNPTATTTSDLSAQEGATPSTSTGHLSVFPAFQVKTPAVPSEQTSQRFSEASHRVLPGGGLRCSHDFGAGVAGHLGLAMFGVGFGSLALLQSVVDENSCCLLYVVEDQLCDVERAFRAEHLANTRVVRGQDADIVLNDQRYGRLKRCRHCWDQHEVSLLRLWSAWTSASTAQTAATRTSASTAQTAAARTSASTAQTAATRDWSCFSSARRLHRLPGQVQLGPSGCSVFQPASLDVWLGFQ
ncbi:putative TP73 antisense gene protein 1 [Hylobates moloch]|uniref:putative TP73 antisense gene protein 1 n=1 Tax=Hylobates moloch TaxID=81572 RepID=UPI00267447E9|nr:putative TP73 antisense gene protein 1 [Hylobates moloch]